MVGGRRRGRMTNRVTTKPSRPKKRAIRIGPRKRNGEGLISEIGEGDPWRYFFDTLGSESSLTASSPPGLFESRVFFGSFLIVSKIPPSARFAPGIIVPDNSPPGD